MASIDFSSLEHRQRQKRLQVVSYFITFVIGMIFALALVWAGWAL